MALDLESAQRANPDDPELADPREEARLLLGPYAEEWLAAKNTLFGGRSPNDLIDSGTEEDSERLREVLRGVRGGVFS